MHVDSPDDSWKDDSWKDDRRLRGGGGNAGYHFNSAKAGNGLSAAKAGAGPSSAGDRRRDPGRSNSSPARTAPRLELSLTQITGSTGAAVTAAFLGSRLGVAGTLIGAALASVISVVGGALYTTSLKATRQQVTKVLVGRTDEETAALPVLPGAPAVAPSAGRRDTRGRRADAAPGRRAHGPRPALRGAVAGALLSAVVFAGALLVVTGVESVRGSALSGGSAGSLTILGGHDAGADRTTRPATPSAPPSTPVSPTTGTGSATVSTSASTTAPTTASTTAGSTASSTAGSSPAAPTTTASPTTGTSPTTGSTAAQQTAGVPAPGGTTPAGTAPFTAAPNDVSTGAATGTAPATGSAASAPAGASPVATADGSTDSTLSSAKSTPRRAAGAPIVN